MNKRPLSRRGQPRRLDTPRSNLNRALLRFIASLGQGVVLYSDFVNYQRAVLQHGWTYAQRLKAIRHERDLQQRLYQLRLRRYVEARRVGKNIELRLSTRGELALMLDRLHQTIPTSKIATIITFDVPESQRFIRRELRLLLKQAKFRRLQDSVWVRPGDVLVAVHQLIHYLKAERWVAAFRTTDLKM